MSLKVVVSVSRDRAEVVGVKTIFRSCRSLNYLKSLESTLNSL